MDRQELRRHRPSSGSYPPARGDGRPLFYDINTGERVQCILCLALGVSAQYMCKSAVMSDPSNPPPGAEQGSIHTVCVHHLPDNAVVYDPASNTCRSKSGDHTWEES